MFGGTVPLDRSLRNFTSTKASMKRRFPPSPTKDISADITILHIGIILHITTLFCAENMLRVSSFHPSISCWESITSICDRKLQFIESTGKQQRYCELDAAALVLSMC